MLVLTRAVKEEIVVGENIVITIVEVRGDKVRVGIKARKHIPIYRMEVAVLVARELLAAFGATPTEIEAEIELLMSGREMQVELPPKSMLDEMLIDAA